MFYVNGQAWHGNGTPKSNRANPEHEQDPIWFQKTIGITTILAAPRRLGFS